ncbi:SAM-dependent methyltransferase [Pontibacillus halophilus JSM 076056 = DSM 19796]|uniref:SAM-dependent methyltransferase n=1 Tax=Pontibacillus halophilus JSM 076056 = DSM 19796 TaxID=1385510 RepID=A0A0A5GH77_9BACI|nr:class I SAM-dependent methyltransferase [Pontibacillus halophilus]KGX90558.1 SAM-dependent methyltransferase [Pontibacillus halophilus JSM 076056 = DSM 19796]
MLEDNGERVIPQYMKPSNNMLLEHMARYQFALPFLEGRVLDLSCGAGYGTHMIAKQRKNEVHEVIGVDIDPDVVHYAKGEYRHPHASYQVADATDAELAKQLGTFDAIVSFETYEHIVDEKALLDNYDRLLKPGGTLIVSTPFGQGRGKECQSPFHVHQITEHEFHHLFDEYPFDHKEFYYQKGVLVAQEPREDVRYPLGIVVCRKARNV